MLEAIVEIRRYTQDLEGSARAFNQRLRAGGEQHWRFPEFHQPRFPEQHDGKPHQEFFVTFHAGEMRGGYLLTHSQFAVRGEISRVVCGPQINLSEGIVDPSYAMVGVIQVQDALRRHPLMYALGMGGMNEPLSKLLIGMGWHSLPVPFYFRVLSASHFCRNMTHLRRRLGGRVALDLLRYTGIGSLGFRLVQARLPKFSHEAGSATLASFGPWADVLWERCRDKYPLIAVRDSNILNLLYPPGDARFHRLGVRRAGRDVGWAVMLDRQMSAHRRFGSMRVGAIIDCLALPEDAHDVIRCATRWLETRGVDMIVSYQASTAWCKALAETGYLNAPSTFILALSPKLAESLEPLNQHGAHIHINRGDGDGFLSIPARCSWLS